MTDELNSKPTFSQCLVHEIKGAYTFYFKCICICTAFCAGLVGLFILFTSIPYDILTYNIKLIPWWIDAGVLVLIPPFMYSVLECLGRRLPRCYVSTTGGILLVIAVVLVMVSIIMMSLYILLVAIICLVVGFWFI